MAKEVTTVSTVSSKNAQILFIRTKLLWGSYNISAIGVTGKNDNISGKIGSHARVAQR